MARNTAPPPEDRTRTGAGEQLLDYLRALRRRLPLMLAVALLTTVVALGFSLSSKKQYDATVELVIQRTEPADTLLNPNGSTAQADPERDLTTAVGLIKLESLARRVRQRLHLSTPPKQLLSEVSTNFTTTSDIIGLSVRDSGAPRAARIANVWAVEYVNFRRSSTRQSLDEAASLARTRLGQLPPTERDSAQGRTLEARLRELELTAALQTGGVQIVRPAIAPGSPSRPRPLLSAVVGLLLGALLGIAVTFGLEFVDRRIKSEETAEQLFGLPLLATIPRLPRRSAPGAPGDDRGQREAYGLLAGSLRFATLKTESDVVLVTSPGPEEGKTSVTLGLARALATLGQSVIVIEADLRRPTFRDYARLSGSRGLSAIVQGAGRLSDELVWLDGATFEPVTTDGLKQGLAFAVLPAGPLPPHPQRMLARPAMGAAIDEARSLADVVLIDTPPVGTVNDALALANYADVAILIARLNKTTKDASRRALRTLSNIALPIVGLVLTDTGSAGVDYYEAPDLALPAQSSEARA